MGRTKPRTISEFMDVSNKFADGEDAYIIKERGHPKMIDPTDIATRGANLAIMTTTIHITR
jgi:hypothetical protein